MIDVHAHIIPGVDDGSRTISESVELCTALYALGFSEVIATPHYSRRYSGKESAAGIIEKTGELNEAVKDKLPGFRVYCGQELVFHESLLEKLKDGAALTLCGSRYLLMEEMPDVSFDEMLRHVMVLRRASYIPVLAHIERYMCLYDEKRRLFGRNDFASSGSPGKLSELKENGAFLQMNYESLEGSKRDYYVSWCRSAVTGGYIDYLGTDCHQTDYRPPRAKEALAFLRENLTEERFREITELNALRFTAPAG